MSEPKNIMGLNLSVDDDVIASAVRESIVLSIAESLKNKEELINQFVKSILCYRVNVENGEPPRYSSDKTCTKLEYMVRKALDEVTREEIKNMIEEQKPQIKSAIRSRLSNTNTQNSLVDMFLEGLKDSITNKYSTKVEFEFKKRNDY